jgi:hypothetical protein
VAKSWCSASSIRHRARSRNCGVGATPDRGHEKAMPMAIIAQNETMIAKPRCQAPEIRVLTAFFLA